MDPQQLKRKSKYISKLLRHDPEDLRMDKNGWVNVDDLMDKIGVTLPELEDIVDNNNKKRFEFDDDLLRTRIRARQGHSKSMKVDVQLPVKTPPNVLYHGTTNKAVDAIMKSGLQPMSRQHVHLSVDVNTAINVGSRHGKPFILTIDAEAMHKAGFKFYLSNNNVWLADEVPARYISK